MSFISLYLDTLKLHTSHRTTHHKMIPHNSSLWDRWGFEEHTHCGCFGIEFYLAQFFLITLIFYFFVIGWHGTRELGNVALI